MTINYTPEESIDFWVFLSEFNLSFGQSQVFISVGRISMRFTGTSSTKPTWCINSSVTWWTQLALILPWKFQRWSFGLSDISPIIGLMKKGFSKPKPVYIMLRLMKHNPRKLLIPILKVTLELEQLNIWPRPDRIVNSEDVPYPLGRFTLNTRKTEPHTSMRKAGILNGFVIAAGAGLTSCGCFTRWTMLVGIISTICYFGCFLLLDWLRWAMDLLCFLWRGKRKPKWRNSSIFESANRK